MIRVQVSETSFRWLMPHRILAVSEFKWAATNIHGEPISYDKELGRSTIFSAGMQCGDHETPPRSNITYQGSAENCPDYIRVKETPEQIAEMVTRAMRPIQIERMLS